MGLRIYKYKSILSSEEFAYTIIEELYKDTPIDLSKEESLVETLTELHRDLECYRYHKPNAKSNILWRLSWVFFFILTLVCLFVVMPIRWIITGNYGLERNKGLGRLMQKWYELI